jgi:hypothetical protein
MPHRVALEAHKAIAILSRVISQAEQALGDFLWLLWTPSRIVPILPTSHAAHREVFSEISDFFIVFEEVVQILFCVFLADDAFIILI